MPEFSESIVRSAGPGRIFIDAGPTTMVASAFVGERPLEGLAETALAAVLGVLARLSSDLPELRKSCRDSDSAALSPVGARMRASVRRVGDPSLTSMAAVAGAIADEVADRLSALGATRVAVNNGGDIALRLAVGERVAVGLVSSLSGAGVDEVLDIAHGDGIGGVATSGQGGRSLTRGIADSVTVTASNCATADAFATYLANCSYVESPRVHLLKAGAIDPGSDIAELDVVHAVDTLTDEEVERGLERIAREAEFLIARGDILGVRASIQGRKVAVSAEGARFDESYRRAG